MQARQAKRLLKTKVGRSELPRYKRTERDKGDRGTVYAFHIKRSPDWVIIGDGWISNMSDADFSASYLPSNQPARDLYALALRSYSVAALAIARHNAP